MLCLFNISRIRRCYCVVLNIEHSLRQLSQDHRSDMLSLHRPDRVSIEVCMLSKNLTERRLDKAQGMGLKLNILLLLERERR